MLKPHHKNFNKIITKRPKIYFYDTGLVCSLLGITTEAQLNAHPLKGHLFETMIVAELIKKRTNAGQQLNLYYWRTKTGHEVDIIIDDAGLLTPVEIKSGKTINNDFFKNLLYWNRLNSSNKGILIYAGAENQQRSNGIEVIGLPGFIKKEV